MQQFMDESACAHVATHFACTAMSMSRMCCSDVSINQGRRKFCHKRNEIIKKRKCVFHKMQYKNE